MKKNVYKFIVIILVIFTIGLVFKDNLSLNSIKHKNNKIKNDLSLNSAISKDIDYEKVKNLANEQNFGEAIEILEEEYKKNPTNIKNNLYYTNVLLSMASLTGQEKKYSSSIIAILKYTLALDKNNSETYRLLGYAYEIIEEYERAIESYNKSININPKNYLTYGNRGHAYLLMGKLEKAKKDLFKAFKLNKNNPQILLNISKIYLMENNMKEVKNILEKVINISKNMRFKLEALYGLGNIYIGEGKLEEAIRLFGKMIEIDNNFELGHIGLAKASFMLFEEQVFTDKEKADNLLLKKAIEEINIGLKINKNKTLGYYYLGLIYGDLGDKEKAILNYNTALKVLDNDITLSKDEKESFKILISNLIKNEKK